MIYLVYPRDCIYSIAHKSRWFDIYQCKCTAVRHFLLQVWLPRAAFKSDKTKNMESDAEYFLDCFELSFFLSVVWAQTASSQTKKYIKM